jgi:hypothetical protein
MSRRWTGWVLTAAAVAAGPAPALSSNDPSNPYAEQHLRATLAGGDGDYTNCLEVTTPREAVAGHSGRILVLQQPYPGSKANGDLRFEADTPSDADESLRRAIERSKGPGFDPVMLRWPAQVRAACGIPGGLTLLVPADVMSANLL